MITPEQYNELKEVIQKVNPEIIGDWSGCIVCGTMCGICENEPLSSRQIRLADVLLAIDKNPLYTKENSYFIDSNGNFHEWFTPKGRLDLRTVANWNLQNDSLDYHYDHQPETVEFLYNLLVTK